MDDEHASGRLSGLIDGALEASVAGSFTRLGPAVRSRLERWEPPAPAPGRVVVVTGASSGLGRTAAIELAGLGCTVVAVGRDERRLAEVVAAITRDGGEATAQRADLGDLAQTADLARRIRGDHDQVEVLVHNAGALLEERRLGAQGHELTLTVHLLSPYLLTELLRAPLTAVPGAKVIVMTSGGMYTERFDLAALEMGAADYRGSVAYARAKRAQVVLVGAWQHRQGPGGIDFHAVHPGWARTPGVADSLPRFNRLLGPMLRTPAEGVDTLVWLATSPPGEPTGGRLWLDRRPRRVHRLASTKVDATTTALQEESLLRWLDETTVAFR